MEVKELGVRKRGVRVGSERESCESRGVESAVRE